MLENKKPQKIINYLKEEGWKQVPRNRNDVAIFQNSTNKGETYQVCIPLDESLGDYKESLEAAINFIEEFNAKKRRIPNPNKEILNLLKSNKYDFLRTQPELGDNIILLVVSGSHAYGLNTPESDLDIRGIAIENEDTLFGLDNFEIFENKETDTVIYSLRNFMRLAMKGSPNMLELLNVRNDDIIYITDEGYKLLENKELFLSKKLYHTIRGFTKNSLNRMEKDTCKNNERACKDAMHLIRLYLSGIEALKTEKLPVYMGDNIPYLMEIRNGKYIEKDENNPENQVINQEFYKELEKYEKELTKAYEESKLPDKVDKNALSELQKEIFKQRYRKKLILNV